MPMHRNKEYPCKSIPESTFSVGTHSNPQHTAEGVEGTVKVMLLNCCVSSLQVPSSK